MKKIFTENAKNPGGHYSQAVEHNGLIYISGQLGFFLDDAPGGEVRVGTAEEQVRNCLISMEEILKAAGSNMNNVIKTTVYVSDGELWGEVNRVYAEVFGDHKPARAIVPCNELHFGFNVEIEAIASL